MAYKQLLHIDIRHGYTQGSALSLLALEPSPATRAWLDRCGFLWRQLNHGYALFGDTSHPAYDLTRERTQNHPFYLIWQPKLPWLANITDLPLGTKAAPYLLQDDSGTVQLHPQSSFMSWVRGAFTWRQEDNVRSWSLHNAQGETVQQGKPAEEMSSLQVMLQGEEEGLYTLYTNDKAVQHFYYGQLSERPFGLLALSIPQLPKATDEAVAYKWKLASRSTYRRYYLIKRDRQLSELALRAETTIDVEDDALPAGLSFTDPQETTTPDGTAAWQSESTVAAPLQATYDWVARLRATGLKEPLTLPHAAPETIFPEGADDPDKMNSVIYVYL